MSKSNMNQLGLTDYLKFLQTEIEWISGEFNRKKQVHHLLCKELNHSLTSLRGYALSTSVLDKGLENCIQELVDELREKNSFPVYAQLNLAGSPLDFRTSLGVYQIIEVLVKKLGTLPGYSEANLILEQNEAKVNVCIFAQKKETSKVGQFKRDYSDLMEWIGNMAHEIGAEFELEEKDLETRFSFKIK
ncbi:MAG: hypothetical protein LCH37_08525 [Bacteroidetes bacterium]|nr:hypothetical protein [Bacteroidota bacterium]